MWASAPTGVYRKREIGIYSGGEEIHKLLMDCYADAKNILVEHRALLDEIAMYLLSKETITGDEFMAYVNADSKKLTDGSEAEEAPAQTDSSEPD